MTYQGTLPKVFPYRFEASAYTVVGLVRALLDPRRTDVPDGSSFAVTADAYGGRLYLWLSNVSYKYLCTLDEDNFGTVFTSGELVETSPGGFGE